MLMSSNRPFLTNVDFPPLKNDLIQRVAAGENVERVPVWMRARSQEETPTKGVQCGHLEGDMQRSVNRFFRILALTHHIE